MWSEIADPPEAITGTGMPSATAWGERNVKTLTGAVPVHRGEQDFTGAERDEPPAAYSTASIPVELRPPWVKISQRSASPGAPDALGVDRHHDALAAEFLRRFLDEFRGSQPLRC